MKRNVFLVRLGRQRPLLWRSIALAAGDLDSAMPRARLLAGFAIALALPSAAFALARPTTVASAVSDVVVRSAYFTGGEGTISCQPGEVATGGGPGVDIVQNTYLARSQPEPPTGTPTGWHAWVRNRTDGSPGSGTVYVICAQAPAPTPTATPTATATPIVTAAPTVAPSSTPTPQVIVRIEREVVYFPGQAVSVQFEWRALRRYTRVSKLTVSGIPRSATLTLRCKGGGCPFARRSRAFPNGARTAKLASLFKSRKLRVKTTLEVQITASGWIGKLVRFKVRANKIPSVTVRCLPPGATAPSRC